MAVFFVISFVLFTISPPLTLIMLFHPKVYHSLTEIFKNQTFKRTPEKKTLWFLTALIATFTVSIGFISIIIIWKLRGSPSDSLAYSTNSEINLFQIFSVILIGPVIEEVIFRHFLFNALKQKYKIFTSVLISALCFAVLHFDNIFGAFIGGILLSFLYLRSGDLVYPIAAHILHNTVFVIFTIKTQYINQSELLVLTPMVLKIASILAIFSILITIIFHRKNMLFKSKLLA